MVHNQLQVSLKVFVTLIFMIQCYTIYPNINLPYCLKLIMKVKWTKLSGIVICLMCIKSLAFFPFRIWVP